MYMDKINIIETDMDIDSLLQEAEKEFKEFQKENPIVPFKNILPFKLGYIRGYEKASKIMYSEEEVLILLQNFNKNAMEYIEQDDRSIMTSTTLKKWFEQFKKK